MDASTRPYALGEKKKRDGAGWAVGQWAGSRSQRFMNIFDLFK